MRRTIALACAVLSLVLGSAACSPIGRPEGPAPLRYRDEVFTTVTRTADVVYGTAVDQTGAEVTLRLDVYEPEGDTVEARPAIVWVHGGGFAYGDKTSPDIVDQANVFARKGYVAVSISYRLVRSGCPGTDQNACITGIIHAREDAQTAVRYLRSQAEELGIDPDRIAIGGSSAGAITALNVGFSPENPGPGDHQGYSSAVRAVQSISGAELVSGPIDAFDSAAIMFHNETDPLVSRDWAQSTVDRAEAVGVQVVLRSFPGTGHVPYAQYRTQILEETTNFFYHRLDLANAPR